MSSLVAGLTVPGLFAGQWVTLPFSIGLSCAMCGRYVLHGPHFRLREYFDLRDCATWVARYNIAPQRDILVVRDRSGAGRVGQLVRWGLLSAWKSPEGQEVVSGCVITTAANSLMAPIHDRMPVLLGPELLEPI